MNRFGPTPTLEREVGRHMLTKIATLLAGARAIIDESEAIYDTEPVRANRLLELARLDITEAEGLAVRRGLKETARVIAAIETELADAAT
jgi:hypothetical protein